MQYEFLNEFKRRMKPVGKYACLSMNSVRKETWKKMGFETQDEQWNMLFTVLLYIMEQTSRDEPCTIDHISAFIDDINSTYLRKNMSSDDCHELADFIVNTVFLNEGRPIYFNAFNYDTAKYEPIYISYIGNKSIEYEGETRTSYYMNEQGYDMVLNTLEVESAMKISVQQLIFNQHISKQSYDKALTDIRTIFHSIKQHIGKINDAIERIRRNVSEYSPDEYDELIDTNLEFIEKKRDEFERYRVMVRERIADLEKIDTNKNDVFEDIDEKGQKQIETLSQIEKCLTEVVDEQLKVLNKHQEVKKIYAEELEKSLEFASVKRFRLKQDFFDKLTLSSLDRLYEFFLPLCNKDPDKVLSLEKVFEPQVIRSRVEDDVATIFFDPDEYSKEKEEENKRKQKQYERIVGEILNRILIRESVTLSEMKEMLNDELIENIDFLKVILAGLSNTTFIDLKTMRKERKKILINTFEVFCLKETILELTDSPAWKDVTGIRVEFLDEKVELGPFDTDGKREIMSCTDIRFKLEKRNGI